MELANSSSFVSSKCALGWYLFGIKSPILALRLFLITGFFFFSEAFWSPKRAVKPLPKPFFDFHTALSTFDFEFLILQLI